VNLCLIDVNGGLLLVPQFTLIADTRKVTRPGFNNDAHPEQGKKIFSYLLEQAKKQYRVVQAGKFGVDMQISLTNDGPVIFWLQV